MSNPHLNRIVRVLSKELHVSDFSAWQWIHRQPTPTLPPRHKPCVCFSGFTSVEKEDLRQLAALAGFRVTRHISKRLSYLCIGRTPGRRKLARAIERGVPVIDLDGFYRASHGEVPNTESAHALEPGLPEFLPDLEIVTGK